MKIHKTDNTSFKALYLPKSKEMAKFALSGRLNMIKPELGNVTKMKEALLKSNPKTGEIYKVYFSSGRAK